MKVEENIDLDSFLIRERQRLKEEKQELLKKRALFISANVTQCLKETITENSNNNEENTEKLEKNEVVESPVHPITDSQQEKTTESIFADLLTKNSKEWVNQKEFYFADSKDTKNVKTKLERGHKTKDDMEQWVTDTFYSYFPGFNNEYQKRQNYLRDRQRQNQENFLKHHQMKSSTKQKAKKSSNIAQDTVQTARSTTSSTSNTTTSHITDKTDLEIIVNNPDYVPTAKQSSNSTGPGSTRHKLLQDLGHIELSKIVAGDGVNERNLRNAEMVTARKKDYQRELMHQIEEKRRSIEILRETEHKQEEIMTRRLQEQLKTIKLQEQFEKEKLKANKIRFDAEKNRLMRENLLAKLENEEIELQKSESNKDIKFRSMEEKVKDKTKFVKTSSCSELDDNKVYKYFSNSARHEYRRDQPLPEVMDWRIELPTCKKIERECFHLSDKICPTCDAPLQYYEICCLRCQKKLSMKLNSKTSNIVDCETDVNNKNGFNQNDTKKEIERVSEKENNFEVEDLQSFSLVCVKCERLYLLCNTCLAKSDVCRACHRKRNVCLNCRRSLCSFCLEEVASGKDKERSHVNEEEDKNIVLGTLETLKENNNLDRSFQILEDNNAQIFDANDNLSSNFIPQKIEKKVVNHQIRNELDNNNLKKNFSTNIERNSVFHPDFQKPQKMCMSFEQLPKVINNNYQEESIDRLRYETDNRLSRYVKNYSDIAKRTKNRNELRNRSTQTIPSGLGRRDVVLNEDHNLSMPLLREMPKMTRKESNILEKQTNDQSKIENLARRWEIPAVQKYSISNTGPKVLTQIGAIRKQLQAEKFFDSDSDKYI